MDCNVNLGNLSKQKFFLVNKFSYLDYLSKNFILIIIFLGIRQINFWFVS